MPCIATFATFATFAALAAVPDVTPAPAARRLNPVRRPGQRACQLLAAVVAVSLCLGCSPSGSDKRQLLIGKWRSSRLITPIHLHDNGEWEIRQDDGTVLQYGLWEYRNHQVVWTAKQGQLLQRDVNAVVSLKPDAFTLRENDQSPTAFTRWPPNPP